MRARVRAHTCLHAPVRAVVRACASAFALACGALLYMRGVACARARACLSRPQYEAFLLKHRGKALGLDDFPSARPHARTPLSAYG